MSMNSNVLSNYKRKGNYKCKQNYSFIKNQFVLIKLINAWLKWCENMRDKIKSNKNKN